MNRYTAGSPPYKPIIISLTLPFRTHESLVKIYQYAAANGLSGLDCDGATATFYIDPEREIELKEDGSIHSWRK